MDPSLALTALFMGLVGGPHCLAMCGPVCAGLAAPAAASGPDEQPLRFYAVAARPTRLRSGSTAPALFLLGRLLSYSALGLVATASMQAVAWLSVQSAALRPIWTFVHVAAAVVGGFLLWQARQPPWLDGAGRSLWLRLRSLAPFSGSDGRRGRGGWGVAAAPAFLGLAWGLLPCGLLYSALLVAALSPGLWHGAGVMALFALGSSLGLWFGSRLWRRLGRGGSWIMRLAGAVLLASSLWALWAGLVLGTAPWCRVPAP